MSPSVDRAARMRRAMVEAQGQGFAAVVVPPSPDLAYLTGYAPMLFERPTLLVLRPSGEAAMLVPELEVPLAGGAIAPGSIELVGWADGADPYEAAARLLPSSGRVAVGDVLWARHLIGLQAALPEVSFAPASPVMARLRAVKEPDELSALSRAARAADETFRQICGTTFLGRREDQVAADLADLLVSNGHAKAAFTIVASGPNAASPHHEPTGRTILPRDAVLLDFGGELGGYHSDTTRTVVVGEPPRGFGPVYEAVQRAQEAAFRAVAPGVEAQEIDRVARRIIDEAGHGARFVHRTGHGIGLEIHEAPYLVEGSRWVLEPGTTFSIEPGVYVEGEFGVRIEDIVVVTEEGADRLNRSTRELQVVS